MQLIDFDPKRWRPISIFALPVPGHAEPIRAFLARHLSEDELCLLAHPARDGATFRWFAHRNGPVLPLSALGTEEQDRAQRSFFATRARINDLVRGLNAFSQGGAPPSGLRPRNARGDDAVREEAGRLAAVLSRLNLIPDRNALFVQSGVPIRVAWGGELTSVELFDDPSVRPSIVPSKPELRRNPILSLFGRTRCSEIALDEAETAEVRAEASSRMARQHIAGDGPNRITLMWDNASDLDLALEAPDGQRVYFGNKRIDCNGASAELDVDMNVTTTGPSFDGKKPVENISVERFSIDGQWRIWETHFKHRFPASFSCPFQVALQVDGTLRLFRGQVAPGDTRVVAYIVAREGLVVSIVGEG